MAQAKQEFQMMREKRGWSLAELARRAECDPGYLGRVERGERQPSPYFRAHLQQILTQREDVA